jgi:hypothetical protein
MQCCSCIHRLPVEAAALQALHTEPEPQCSVSALRSVAAVVDSCLTESGDDDDDCPILMHAALLTSDSNVVGEMTHAATTATSSGTHVAAAAGVATPMATVTSSSDGFSSWRVSSTAVGAAQQQHKQSKQQPCLQCGSYCSEECQMQWFEDLNTGQRMKQQQQLQHDNIHCC